VGHAVQWYLETWAPCHSPWKFTIQVSTCPRQTKLGALLRSEAERWLGDPPPGRAVAAPAQRCQRPAGANRAVRNARTKSGMAPSKSLCPRTMRTSASSGFFSRARCANEEACACACAHHCGATKAAGKRKRCDRPARQGLDVEASVANAERSSARGRRGFLRTTPWGLYLLTAASPPLAIC
jgi:hypothetical protein